MEHEGNPAAVAFEERDLEPGVALQDTAADDVDHGHHIGHGVLADVPQQEIVAEHVTHLADLAGRSRRMEAHGDAQLLQGGPQDIVIAGMPRQGPERLGPGEHGHETQFLHRPASLLGGLGHIVERNHGRALHPLGVCLAEVVEPVVVGPGNRRAELGIHLVAHHHAQADGRIHDRQVQSLFLHGVELRDPVETAGAGIGDLGIDAPGVEDAAAVGRRVALEDLAVEHDHGRAAGGGAEDPGAPVAPLGLHVLLPQVRGLAHVHVRVHDFQSVLHELSSPTSVSCNECTRAAAGD